MKNKYDPVSYPVRAYRLSDEVVKKLKKLKKKDSWDTLFNKLLEGK